MNHFTVVLYFTTDVDGGTLMDALMDVPGCEGGTIGGTHDWDEDVKTCQLCGVDVMDGGESCPTETKRMREAGVL